MEIPSFETRLLNTQRHAASFQRLRDSVMDGVSGNPCVAGCRSVCWKAFLVFQRDLDDTWCEPLATQRSAYTDSKRRLLKFIKNPGKLSTVHQDPLADDPNSPWNTTRHDESIRAEILQDVRRLPDNEPFYHRDDIQAMILDVLFVYCKLNPELGYRQGMHELLAPLVYVLQRDAVHPSLFPSNPLMSQILDSSCVEQDSFILFSRLMARCTAFFSPEMPPTVVRDAPRLAPPIVEKSRYIHEGCLARVDPELAAHLTDIEVPPQIFLIRWIRLLFGREFPLNHLLVLWDALFAQDPALGLVDFVCVVMLLRVRRELLAADFAGALQLLLNYPVPNSKSSCYSIVEDAAFLATNRTPEAGSTVVLAVSGKMPFNEQAGLSPYNAPRDQPHGPSSGTVRRFAQQDDVKSIFSDAATRILQQGKRLSMAKLLRDGPGDAQQNSQGALNTTASCRSPEAAASAAMAITETRNQHLSLILEDVLGDLQALIDDRSTAKGAIELIAAKVHFVKTHLEDAGMVLEQDSLRQWPEENSIDNGPKPLGFSITAPHDLGTVRPGHHSARNRLPVRASSVLEEGVRRAESGASTSRKLSASQIIPAFTSRGNQPDVKTDHTNLPKSIRPVVLPSRSSIAQSSFAFMVEDPEISKGRADAIGEVSQCITPSERPTSPGSDKRAPRSRDRRGFLFHDQTAGYDKEDGNGIFGLVSLDKVKK